jgi:hypothetical protein
MKTKAFIITAFAIIIIISYGNSAANNTSQPASKTLDKIIGTWIPIALDFSLQGKTEPSGKWVYNTKQNDEAIKKSGLDEDFANFTFKANGTGYLGASQTKENTFKWKKIANGKVIIDNREVKNTVVERIEEFYLDAKGQLIFHHSEKQFIMGKSIIQNSFELYKRK